MTPTFTSAITGEAIEAAITEPRRTLRSETCTDITSLEGLTHRELKPLHLIRIGVGVALVRIERDRITEPEHSEWREPLHRHARRVLQFIILELVLDRLEAPAGERVAVARREDVADVVEHGKARRGLELLW